MTEIIITFIVVTGTLGGLAMGNRARSKCRHKYETISYHIIDIYEADSPREKKPIARKTHLTQECEKCGDPKLTTLSGIWDPENRYNKKIG